MIGLDNAGKTQILYQLTENKEEVKPTFGFNSGSVVLDTCSIYITDLGGQEKIRPLWNHYGRERDLLLVIWVQDCANPKWYKYGQKLMINGYLNQLKSTIGGDIPREITSLCIQYYGIEELEDRMELSKEMLHHVIDTFKNIDHAVLLVYANKQDTYKALSIDEVRKRLQLDKWKYELIVQPCCGLNGDGLKEGLRKFDKIIRKRGR